MPSTAVTVIHKFIRREMFDFAERLFRAEPDDVGDVQAALSEVASLLRGHAEHEDAHLAPLLREVALELAERMARDHRRLEDQLERLCAEAQELNSSASDCGEALLRFHLNWNRFLSAYLAHLDDEERTLFAALKEGVPPVTAIAQSAASPETEESRVFLLRLWSVTTCAERIAIERAIEQGRAAAASEPRSHRDDVVATAES